MPIQSRRTGAERVFRIPSQCPVCGADAIRPDGEAVSRCTGLECPAQLEELIKHFASKHALDIDGLGDKLVHQLVEKGLVTNLPDLYRLDLACLANLERMGEKSAKKLLQALEKSKQTTLKRFLYALGIRYVGEHVAEVLANNLGTLAALVAAPREALESIPEIGPQIAESVYQFFRQASNRHTVGELLHMNVRLEEPGTHEADSQRDLPLAKKTFVLTGTLSAMTRQEAKERIERLGGRVASSVSTATDYVVVGQSPGSKIEKARQHGISTLDEKSFLALLE